jgi:hypothetical protein
VCGGGGGLGGLGFSSWHKQEFFLLHSVQTSHEAHPALYTVGTGASFPMWGNQLGHGSDHSPPSSAKVENGGAIPSLPPHIYMVWCLIKHRDNFTYTQCNVLIYVLVVSLYRSILGEGIC